jgi:hypothetical protein
MARLIVQHETLAAAIEEDFTAGRLIQVTVEIQHGEDPRVDIEADGGLPVKLDRPMVWLER